MKTIFPLIVTVTTILVTLLECPLQSNAMPTSTNPDCARCKEFDITDDEHSLCSFGCSYDLQTTLPVDATEDEQRDLAEKIFPILKFLRNLKPQLTTPELYSGVQVNHGTMDFEPLVTKKEDVEEDDSAMHSSLIDDLILGSFFGEDEESEDTSELSIPHVLSADPSDYDITVQGSSGITFGLNQPIMYHSATGGDRNLRFNGFVMVFPSTHDENPLSTSVKSEPEPELQPEQKFESDPEPKFESQPEPNFNSEPEFKFESQPNPEITPSNNNNSPNFFLPSTVATPIQEVPEILRGDMGQNTETETDEDDVEEILFAPLSQGNKIDPVIDSTTESYHGDDHIEEIVDNTNPENDHLNEIAQESIHEVTKKLIRIPKKPSLLDMYSVEDSNILESKRRKKNN